MKKVFTIATRQSQLALWQAHYLKKRLQALYPADEIDILGLTTQGDKALSAKLSDLGGKGVFVKELEDALLAKEADIAIHCAKDMPAILPDGLILPVVLARETVNDVLLAPNGMTLATLPPGARVGTSSLRRMAQLKAIRPDLIILPLRGNVDTRIKKLKAGEYDAILLAAAGLHRLGLQNEISEYLSLVDHLPAPGQGALVLECRSDDRKTLKRILPLHDPITAEAIKAERRLTALLGGSCDLPLAALAQLEKKGGVSLSAMIIHPTGAKRLVVQEKGESEATAEAAAIHLLQQGADEILAAVSQPLLGKRILNTRPPGQNTALSARLRALGAEVVEAPALRIEYYDEKALNEIVQGWAFDEIIITSQNVITVAQGFLKKWFEQNQKPLLAVGKTSADALRAKGWLAQAAPAPHNSEALLSLQALKADIRDKLILILKGEGGLGRLAPELTARGARVLSVDCYKRHPAEVAEAVFETPYHAVIATSDSGLLALMASCPEHCKPLFLQNQLLVMGERTQKIAQSLHFKQIPWLAPVASDAGLILSLLTHHACE